MDYKKKLRLAKEALDSGSYDKETIEYIFPELAESEDERISREITEFILTHRIDEPNDIEDTNSWLAWLEKQGDLTIRFSTDEFELALGRIIAFWNQNHKDGKYDENELMSYIKVRETELVKLFTDNACKVSLSDCSEEYRKAYYDGYNKCNRDWLEIKDISVDEYNKNAEILLGGKVKQKSVDKVEPQFKVGDWIVGSNSVYKVISLNDELSCYIVINVNNEEIKIPYYFDCGPNHMCSYHLWTIQDAKDGDVLVDVYGNISIYEKCDDFDWMSYCSLGHNGGFQHFKIEHENEKTYPATKEQSELLFTKMEEAGYEWDAEKKELRKIENSPILSNSSNTGKDLQVDNFDAELNALLKKYEHLSKEELQEPLEFYLGVVRDDLDVVRENKPKRSEEGIREAQLDYWRSVGGKEWHGVPVQETITWLEKQKSVEWRKEDGMIFDELYDFLINKKVVLQRDCNIYAHWLKSLKQRMEE